MGCEQAVPIVFKSCCIHRFFGYCREALTMGSSKINQHCWRFHGSGVIAAPQIIGLISFCTGMHHDYFFEVVNVLSCSPFMFENTENKQLIDG